MHRRTYGSKHFHHPLVGELVLDYEALAVTGEPDQVLGIYTAEAGSAAGEALRLLASWTSEAAAPDRPNLPAG